MKVKVAFKVDARSLRSFKRNVDVAIAGVAGCTKESIRDFCNEVLFDAVQLVPIDTGALANSADYEIKGNKKKGYEARMGFGVGKRNPVNKRTGKKASSYAGAVHENIGKKHETGQSKFFEQALYQHEQELETKTGKAIRDYLSSEVVEPKGNVPDEDRSAEAARNALAQSRMAVGFTAQVEGKYLPYPVPKGMIYRKGSQWFLNKDFYKQQKDTRPKSVRKNKTTKKTAQTIRSKESARYSKKAKTPDPQKKTSTPRYIKKKAQTKKRTKRTVKRVTTAVKEAAKVTTKRVSTAGKIKGTRTKANKKTTKNTFLETSLRHETALDEFMEHLMDESSEDKKKKKKKGRYNGPIA